MQLSISLNGGKLTWATLRTIAPFIEQSGFSCIYCSDHFDRLDPWVALTYLANHTQSIQIGTLVSPLSFRDPATLARNASAINELSDGRLILGVGAGWSQSEHDAFGYMLGDMSLRMARLAEGVEVIYGLLKSDSAVTFSGRHYQLKDAKLYPPPFKNTRILIGGTGPKRTLPIVARFADVWNCQLVTADVFKERNEQLDELLIKEGRNSGAVKRTALIPVLCGKDAHEMDQVAQDVKKVFTGYSAKSNQELFDFLRTVGGTVIGTPEEVIRELTAYKDAGVEELVIAHLAGDATTNLERIARDVLPHV